MLDFSYCSITGISILTYVTEQNMAHLLLPFSFTCIEYSPMNTVYLYDHNAVPPTWEIKVENPEPSENLSGGAPILLRAPTKKFWREAP